MEENNNSLQNKQVLSLGNNEGVSVGYQCRVELGENCALVGKDRNRVEGSRFANAVSLMDDSTVDVGKNSAIVVGDNSNVDALASSSILAESDAVVNAEEYSVISVENDSIVNAKDSVTVKGNENCKLSAMDFSTLVGGVGSKLTSGAYCVNVVEGGMIDTGDKSIAIAYGKNSVIRAGLNSLIVFVRETKERMRYASAIIDGEKFSDEKFYTLDDVSFQIVEWK